MTAPSVPAVAGGSASIGAAKLALCICTADRADGLARLLATLATCELRPSGIAATEIVVVDNRPGDAVPAVVADAAARWHLAAVAVGEPAIGIPSARNRAVAEGLARGADWIAFLDDDDEPRPDWLAALVARQRATAADLVFGNSSHAPDVVVPGWAARVPYFQPIRLGSLNAYGLPAGASTANVLISRAVLEALRAEGPFRAAFAGSGGEDTDLFIRADRAGFRHTIAADSLVLRRWSGERLTFRGLWRRAMKYGRTRHNLRRMNPVDEGDRPRRLRMLRRAAEKAADCVPALLRPDRLVQRSLRLAEQCGELAAACGSTGRYYLDRTPTRRR